MKADSFIDFHGHTTRRKTRTQELWRCPFTTSYFAEDTVVGGHCSNRWMFSITNHHGQVLQLLAHGVAYHFLTLTVSNDSMQAANMLTPSISSASTLVWHTYESSTDRSKQSHLHPHLTPTPNTRIGPLKVQVLRIDRTKKI